MTLFRLAIACCATLAAAAAVWAQPLPQVGSGRVERLDSFPSKFVDARHIDIWLPAGYSADKPGKPDKRYRVLYMHDGQMLFDPATTWNKQAWQADVALARLVREGQVRDTLIVGIWNNGKFRHSEYFPQKFLPHLNTELCAELEAKALQRKPQADAYLRFIVEELKPAIDRRYATRPEREHTFVMGSSMGGLISIYALAEYPQVFGGAAALSTHWIGGHERNTAVPDAALAYLRQKLPPPGGHRIWMDRGTTELDALYDAAQARVDALMQERGFALPGFTSRVFEGTGHNEGAWRERLHLPLRFLLGD